MPVVASGQPQESTPPSGQGTAAEAPAAPPNTPHETAGTPPDSPPPVAPATTGSPRTPGRDLRAAAGLVAVMALLGLPIGALWRWIVPKVEMVHVDAGWGLAQESPKGYVAADGTFALLGLGVGIVAAIVVWTTMRARRGPILITGLVAGGIAHQVVAWRFGTIGRADYVASLEDLPVGWHAWRVPELLMVDFRPVQAWQRIIEGDVSGAFGHLALGVLATTAFAAAFTFTVCAGWSKYTSLRGDDVSVDTDDNGRYPSRPGGVTPTMQNAPTSAPDGRLPSLTC